MTMTLFIRELGEKDGPTLVLLHGGGVSGWMWEPVAQRLPDFHCFIPDLPEHGQSIEEKPFTMVGAANDIANLIGERVPSGRAHVAGLSLGGQTVIQMLATAPQVINHAIASGTLVRPYPGTSMLTWIAKMYMPFRNIDWLVRANLRSNGIPPEYLARFREDTRRLTAESFAHVIFENAGFKIPEAARRAHVPTLVMVGEKEPKVVLHSARDLTTALPRATGRVVLGHSHSWVLQDPDLGASVIRAWLKDEPLPEAALLPIS